MPRNVAGHSGEGNCPTKCSPRHKSFPIQVYRDIKHSFLFYFFLEINKIWYNLSGVHFCSLNNNLVVFTIITQRKQSTSQSELSWVFLRQASKGRSGKVAIALDLLRPFPGNSYRKNITDEMSAGFAYPDIRVDVKHGQRRVRRDRRAKTSSKS